MLGWVGPAGRLRFPGLSHLHLIIGAQCAVAEHPRSMTRKLRPYFKIVRPHQWIKNTLVFVPALAAHQMDWLSLMSSAIAFVAFCLVASSVYVLNDQVDVDNDRSHPRKRHRPFASGSLPISHGPALIVGLGVAGAGISAVLGWQFVFVLMIYWLSSTVYSLVVKRYVAADICLLAGLYTARIIAGGAATGIPISVWLLAFSIFFFLSLAAVKRQAELVNAADSDDPLAKGRGYTRMDTPVVSQMGVAAGYVSVLIMALYVNSPAVAALYSTPAALWGVCIVLLYWISRIAIITHRGGMHDDPIIFAVKDPPSLICGLLVATLVITGAQL